jgi:hypothetical protein
MQRSLFWRLAEITEFLTRDTSACAANYQDAVKGVLTLRRRHGCESSDLISVVGRVIDARYP